MERAKFKKVAEKHQVEYKEKYISKDSENVENAIIIKTLKKLLLSNQINLLPLHL